MYGREKKLSKPKTQKDLKKKIIGRIIKDRTNRYLDTL